MDYLNDSYDLLTPVTYKEVYTFIGMPERTFHKKKDDDPEWATFVMRGYAYLLIASPESYDISTDADLKSALYRLGKEAESKVNLSFLKQLANEVKKKNLKGRKQKCK